jgi:hypothetical protein
MAVHVFHNFFLFLSVLVRHHTLQALSSMNQDVFRLTLDFSTNLPLLVGGCGGVQRPLTSMVTDKNSSADPKDNNCSAYNFSI